MIILASKSPRRKELLSSLISNFEIIPSSIKEIGDMSSPISFVKSVAKSKGDDIFNSHPNDLIISGDTIVVYQNKILGKPKDKLDAYNTLKMLSGNVHEVISAIYLKSKEIEHLEAIVSKVYFAPFPETFINEYINSNSPLDKAGSYGIQDEMLMPYIKGYEGSLTNIIGLPVEALKETLQKYKIPTK